MLRDFLTGKWVLGGFGFLIVFGIAYYFWYQHEFASYKQEASEAREQLKASQKAADAPQTDFINTAPTNGTANTTDTVSENIDNSMPQETASVEKTDKDVPVSPYGFGPYPPLPPGWRGTPERTWNNLSANHELIARVQIKLRWEGVDVRGAVMKYGKVYPIIKGICYVRWETENTPMGEYRYIAGSTGHPDDGGRLRAIKKAKFNRGEDDDLTEADIPPDIKLVPYEKGGVDPYEFLGLTPP